MKGKQFCEVNLQEKEYVHKVKATWKIFRELPAELFGGLYFNRLFVQDPTMKRLFKGNESQYYTGLYKTVNYAVKNMDEIIDQNQPCLEIFRNLFPFSILYTEFKILHSTFIWTLEKGLGNEWNNHTMEAWNLLLNHIEKAACIYIIRDEHTSNEI